MDLAQKIYAKRDELQTLINEAVTAGYRVNFPRDTLAGITVSETAKSAKAEAPAAAPAASEESPAEKPKLGLSFGSKKGTE